VVTVSSAPALELGPSARKSNEEQQQQHHHHQRLQTLDRGQPGGDKGTWKLRYRSNRTRHKASIMPVPWQTCDMSCDAGANWWCLLLAAADCAVVNCS
jgi:hypothetical protein